MTEQLRGAFPASPLNVPTDPRIQELIDQLRALLPGVSTATAAPISDPFRTSNVRPELPDAGVTLLGLVTNPIAGLGWYQVQLPYYGSLPCRVTSCNNYIPIGARQADGIAANTLVRVFVPQGGIVGDIREVLPPARFTNRLANPDFLSQGNANHYQTDLHVRHMLANVVAGGYVMDFSHGRPGDLTSLDKSCLGATGAGWLVSDWLVWLRVNEMCGLFLNYLDDYARLIGRNLDVLSQVHEARFRDDEGEPHIFYGHATYLHEALGLRNANGSFTVANPAAGGTNNASIIEISPAAANIQPIYRDQEYHGYLGQGGLRTVVRPASLSGISSYGDRTNDATLLMESRGLNGAYTLVSAKEIYIGKRTRIPNVKQVHKPESAAGDDRSAGNYRAASLHGTGTEHKIADVKFDAEITSIANVVCSADYVSFLVNWQSVHPFYYHQQDFAVGVGVGAQNRATLDYSRYWVDAPTPYRIVIDHRFGAVNYYERDSFFRLTDDGSVIFCGGAGETLVLGGGQITLSAPNGIVTETAGTHVVVADQSVVLANTAIDHTVNTGSYRVKAQTHLQLLAVDGGLLLETKSKGKTQNVANLIGDDVELTGIILKSSFGGDINVYGGQDIYLRTAEGKVTIDAAKGLGDFTIKSRKFNAFSDEGMSIYVGRSSQASTAVEKVYEFGRERLKLANDVTIDGSLSIAAADGNARLLVAGSIDADGSIAVTGSVASKDGGFVGKIPDEYTSTLRERIELLTDGSQEDLTQAQELVDSVFTDGLYAPQQAGDDANLKLLMFSFRDDSQGKQYKAESFVWLEAYWKQYLQQGLASGLNTWTQIPVIYQGIELYPWPGRANILERDAVVGIQAPQLTAAAADAAPGVVYEDVTLRTVNKKFNNCLYTRSD